MVDPFIGSTFYAEHFVQFLRAARKRNSCDYLNTGQQEKHMDEAALKQAKTNRRTAESAFTRLKGRWFMQWKIIDLQMR